MATVQHLEHMSYTSETLCQSHLLEWFLFVSAGQQTKELKWSLHKKLSFLKIFCANLFSHAEIGVPIWFMLLILIVIGS